jgi:triacylglycerol lipase
MGGAKRTRNRRSLRDMYAYIIADYGDLDILQLRFVGPSIETATRRTVLETTSFERFGKISAGSSNPFDKGLMPGYIAYYFARALSSAAGNLLRAVREVIRHHIRRQQVVRDPIVLVHGILGFDELRMGPLKLGDYFRGVRKTLEDAGNTVADPPRLAAAGSIKTRAGDLKKYLDDHPELQKVHLIAHSMGGLDSRYLISCLGMTSRVLTLTTLGTPHRGTPFADQGVDCFGPVIELLLDQGINVRGFLDLTTSACAQFNADTPDAPGVRYYSVAGQFEPRLGDLLQVPHGIIQAAAGANDGLVPVSSATYGQFLGTWAVDHFRLINWATNILIPPSELGDKTILDDYLGLIERLAAEGF